MDEKMLSVVRGAIIAGAGAVLAYATERLGGLNFGAYGPVVAALLAVGVNALRKYMPDTPTEPPTPTPPPANPQPPVS